MHKQVLQKNETRAQKATAATANAEACNVCEGDYSRKKYLSTSQNKHKIDRDAGEYALLVRWEGLEDIEASWELLSKLMRECPAVVRAYAKSIKQKKAREDLEAAMAK
ncbi:unnamed protein product [Aphanomyces euteiches]